MISKAQKRLSEDLYLPPPSTDSNLEGGFGDWPVSQCPLLTDRLSDGGILWNEDRYRVDKALIQAEQDCDIQMTNMLHLKRMGKEGYN